MQGLGDNLYQRAVIREVRRPVFLETSWPQLYADLPIQCVRPSTRLRTQAKNAARSDLHWAPRPTRCEPMRWHYVGRQGPILASLALQMGVRARVFDGPPVQQTHGEPYVVVRPATIRAEWRADSRNPRPEYLERAVQALRGGYRIVSVADLKDGAEWPAGPLPYADERYHAGELQLEQLLALVAGAAAVVGGVGWLALAAVAYRVPMLLVFGGWGVHNGPARIFGPPMDVSRIQQALPDRFCMCSSATHACDKRISNFDAHVDAFALRIAAREAAAVAA